MKAKSLDFGQSPLVVLWELTRACDLVCKHCRALAAPFADPRQLSTAACFKVLRQIREFTPDNNLFIVLTGGDPFMRTDLEEIVAYASSLNLRTTLTPSATERVHLCRLARLKTLGLSRVAVSIDGATATTHDGFRGVDGTFEKSKAILAQCRELGFETQINTTLTRFNLHEFDAIMALCSQLEVALWSVFFLVPTGRGEVQDALSAIEMEWIFKKMADVAKAKPFAIKSTAAPQYRRVCAQHHLPNAVGVNDGNGLMFISHTGEVYPSGFLPHSAGNVRDDHVVSLYRHSPLFTQLRDPFLLKGKCGACEFKKICGGSRARAYALFGDYLASDPFCLYVPKSYSGEPRIAVRRNGEMVF